jgi:hypothetical protein
MLVLIGLRRQHMSGADELIAVCKTASVHRLYTHTFTLVSRHRRAEPRLSNTSSPCQKHCTEEEKRCRELEMDKTLIIVCSAVGSLGVLSAILGFSAEGTKLTVSTTADLPS